MDDVAPVLPMPDAIPAAVSPIVVDPSALPDLLVTGMRQIVLVVGGSTSLLGLFQGRDVAGVGQYIMSNDFAIFVAAAATLYTMGYGLLKTLWNKRRSVILANAVPDSVAIVQPHARWWSRVWAAF